MTATTTMRRIGQSSTWTATFTDDDGNLINPSTVTFRWKLATDNTDTAYTFGTDSEVTHPSTGVYLFRSPAYTESARYLVRVESTGPATAEEDSVDVMTSAFA